MLEGLKPYGYSGIDEPTKVQDLLDGVKTDKLESVRTIILSSAPLRSDFKGCVSLMQDYIRQDKTNQPRVQIASIKKVGGKPKKGKGGANKAKKR